MNLGDIVYYHAPDDPLEQNQALRTRNRAAQAAIVADVTPDGTQVDLTVFARRGGTSYGVAAVPIRTSDPGDDSAYCIAPANDSAPLAEGAN